jgi:formylglycine-generating enzyme required for sulfatase activity
METKELSLLALIKDSFNDEELHNLCFEININYEDLPAVGRAGKARELILACERDGRLPLLIAQLTQLRPHLNWPSTARPLTQSQLFDIEEKPRLYFEPETIEIPAGPFIMGRDAGEVVDVYETPAHEVHLERYWIGKYPITNQQYAEFIKYNPTQDEPRKVGWSLLREPPPDKLDHPVSGVSWHDALAYCQWLSQKTDKAYRLLTEAEWEKAARGPEGRLFTWGDVWEDGRCAQGGDDASSVTAYPTGASYYGVMDLLGNVQEWMSTLWGSDNQEPDYAYPYRVEDGREDLDADARLHRVYRIHRGGSYRSNLAELCTTTRGTSSPTSKLRWRGFRVALSK